MCENSFVATVQGEGFPRRMRIVELATSSWMKVSLCAGATIIELHKGKEMGDICMLQIGKRRSIYCLYVPPAKNSILDNRNVNVRVVQSLTEMGVIPFVAILRYLTDRMNLTCTYPTRSPEIMIWWLSRLRRRGLWFVESMPCRA